MSVVLVPSDPALLSAHGLGEAVLERFAERQVLRSLDACETELGRLLDELEAEAGARLAAEGAPPDRIRVRRRMAGLRLAGQESSLQVELVAGRPLRDAFESRYVAVFGHAPERRPIEVESIRAVASAEEDEGPPARGRTAPGDEPPASAAAADPQAPGEGEARGPRRARTVRAWFGGGWRDVPAHDRAALSAGAAFDGPALVFERHSATVVEPGWRGEVDPHGALVLRRAARAAALPASRPRAVRLELFTNRLGSIAREMGQRLRRVSLSVNVKERLDFS
jgi:5-oxoprolinase (ATP-hydrolysing)